MSRVITVQAIIILFLLHTCLTKVIFIYINTLHVK